MFLWKCRSFWDRKCLDPRGTRTPTFFNSCLMLQSFELLGKTFIIWCLGTLALAVKIFLFQSLHLKCQLCARYSFHFRLTKGCSCESWEVFFLLFKYLYQYWANNPFNPAYVSPNICQALAGHHRLSQIMRRSYDISLQVSQQPHWLQWVLYQSYDIYLSITFLWYLSKWPTRSCTISRHFELTRPRTYTSIYRAYMCICVYIIIRICVFSWVLFSYSHLCQSVSDPGMQHGTCVTHVPWCMSGSLTRGGGENVPGIPGACATRNFTYLARGPLPHICVSELGQH